MTERRRLAESVSGTKENARTARGAPQWSIRGLAALRAQAALTAASETVPSAGERCAEAAAADVLAASGAGAVAKTAIGVAGRLWMFRLPTYPFTH